MIAGSSSTARLYRRSTTTTRTSPAPDSSRTFSRSKPLEPPVTKGTLSELDVTKIIHNPKLRHDINFDPELHFRPNTDGEKGRRKQQKASLFWKALGEQLTMFIVNRDEFMSRYGNGEEWCLPLLLKSVKEIIQTLVPSKDRAYLDEGLNVNLIMQQFSKGMADLEKLASWLSGVLKSHCAPMRDEWVEEMHSQLTTGNRNNDIDLLVGGMRNLLSVLEAMKLDVANHQIRCLRPILIEDTIHFEQRFFLKKIRDGKLDPMPANDWYEDMVTRYAPATSSSASNQAFGEMSVFMEAISRMVLPSHPEAFPDTFVFDEERLLKLRSDMLDAINLEICMRVCDEYRSSVHAKRSVPAYTPNFLGSSEDEASTSSRPTSMIFGSASGSPHSSPRSSLILISPPPSPDPTSLGEDRRATRSTRTQDLYGSLVALLQGSSSSSSSGPSGAISGQLRWQVIRDSLALEVFRHSGAPNEALLHFEDKLAAHLCEPRSPLFQSVERDLHRRLMAELRPRVREFRGLTSVGLFSAATGGRLNGPGRTWTSGGPSQPQNQHQHQYRQHSQREGIQPRELLLHQQRDRADSDSSRSDAREEAGIDDIATRLGHLATLHWRVWAQLVYLRDFDDFGAPVADGEVEAGFPGRF